VDNGAAQLLWSFTDYARAHDIPSMSSGSSTEHIEATSCAYSYSMEGAWTRHGFFSRASFEQRKQMCGREAAMIGAARE
jgi:hypothetical protein